MGYIFWLKAAEIFACFPGLASQSDHFQPLLESRICTPELTIQS